MGSDGEEGYEWDRDLFGDDDGGGTIVSDVEDEVRRNADDRRGEHQAGSASESEKKSGNEDDKKEDEKSKEPKKVKVKRTGPIKRLLLDEDRLCGKDGLIRIEEVFKDFKFYGKGHEQQDLDRVLQKLEHWVHVLHPRFPFDQTLERIEFLGAKRPRVKVCVKKIRMGLISATQKEDDFLNIGNDLSSDDNGIIEEAPPLETNSAPANPEQENDDQFDDDFPDIPEEMMLEDNF